MERHLRAEMDEVEILYAIGNYRQLRAAARRLLNNEHIDEESKQRISLILEAISVDPVAITVFVGSLATLLFLVLTYAI
jgi:hypothetical protein